jgi:patatin-like phospholipase/acyl hydrolase
MTYHILSLDGGGVRGVLTSRLLARLEAARPGFLAGIDLFAGTSTGGILALGLAAGRAPEDCSQLYESAGPRVFEDSWLDNLKDLGMLIGAQYSNVNLKQVLTEQMGEMTLADLRRRVLIASFDLDNEGGPPPRMWKAKFFHNFPGPSSDGHEKVVDVAIRSSAAPGFFPIYQGYIDGGISANNPAMCAVAKAINPVSGGQRLDDIVLLSVGTGLLPTYIPEKDADWGLAQWAGYFLGLVMDGNNGLPDYQCQQLLGERYYRLNPVLPRPIRLDNLAEAPVLRAMADEADLSGVVAWLDRYF